MNVGVIILIVVAVLVGLAILGFLITYIFPLIRAIVVIISFPIIQIIKLIAIPFKHIHEIRKETKEIQKYLENNPIQPPKTNSDE